MGIEINMVCKSFGTPPTRVLTDVCATIPSGSFATVTGRSGSGKSTLLYLISTLDMPTSGKIEIDGNDIGKMSTAEVHKFRNQNMGFVFQFHYLLPELTAIENVLLPAMKAGRLKERETFAHSLLEEVGLAQKPHRFPGQLSGGEQQRVAIARALVMEPAYIFADEPTGNLDSINGNAVMDLFQKINREMKTTIIYVTHDTEFAARANLKINLVDGRVEN